MREVPPYAQLLKLRFESRDGAPVVVMPFHEDVIGRPVFLHGGAIAGLLEFAAYTTLSGQIGDETVAMKPVTVIGPFAIVGSRSPSRTSSQYRGVPPRICSFA